MLKRRKRDAFGKRFDALVADARQALGAGGDATCRLFLDAPGAIRTRDLRFRRPWPKLLNPLQIIAK